MENSNQENSQPKLPKTEVFKTTQKYFAIMGISPKLGQQPYPFDWKMLMPFLSVAIGIGFIGVYIFVYVNTFFEYVQAFFFCAAGSFVNVLLLITIFKVEKLFEIIDRCGVIVNMTLKYSATRLIYHEANQVEEKLSKIIFFIMVKGIPICTLLVWAIYIYFIYFTTDLGSDAFEYICPMWFPFDWKTPLGFLLAMAIQYAMVSWGLLIGACVLILSIGFYLYVMAMSKCIKGSLFAINRNVHSKTDQSILLEQLIEFLESHSSAKQLVSNVSDIVDDFVALTFTCSLVVMCGAMLMLQILLNESGNLAMLLVTTIETCFAFSVMFICCELGQHMNVAFEECGQMVDQFDWYLFPPKIQRMLPLILNFAHQPFEITFFGSAACDRETFKYVIKTAFSYFMVLRRFYN